MIVYGHLFEDTKYNGGIIVAVAKELVKNHCSLFIINSNTIMLTVLRNSLLHIPATNGQHEQVNKRNKKPLAISFDQFISIAPDGQDLYGLVAIQIVAQPVDINIHGFAIEHIVAAP